MVEVENLRINHQTSSTLMWTRGADVTVQHIARMEQEGVRIMSSLFSDIDLRSREDILNKLQVAAINCNNESEFQRSDTTSQRTMHGRYNLVKDIDNYLRDWQYILGRKHLVGDTSLVGIPITSVFTTDDEEPCSQRPYKKSRISKIIVKKLNSLTV